MRDMMRDIMRDILRDIMRSWVEKWLTAVCQGILHFFPYYLHGWGQKVFQQKSGSFSLVLSGALFITTTPINDIYIFI